MSMNKFLVIAGIVCLTLLGTVPANGAVPSVSEECRDTKHQQYATANPMFYYNLAMNALTRSNAIQHLKQAETCYSAKSDRAGVEKVQTALSNVDRINFAANRAKRVQELSVGDGASKHKVLIRKISRLKDSD
jgi:hypothetical protein